MACIINKYSKANLGWLYYKQYYKNPETPDVQERNNQGKDVLANRNETILKRKFSLEKSFSLPVNCNSIRLKINYPGLLLGSGYTHEAAFQEKDDKEDSFKIGFFFDHVTGMPCIPGHSVKGALRAVFPELDKKGKPELYKKENYDEPKSSMIMEYLEINQQGNKVEQCFDNYMKKCGISNVEYSAERFAKLLGHIIFEGKAPYDFKNNEFLYKQIPLYKRDIFYDAYLSHGGKDGLFLGTDYITPHPYPLKNPNPIKFLKILPGVKIQFPLDLKDNLISAKEKESLFKKILLDFGIGAKTNVGYGQFRE
jgi:CRISPR-associated protein Cmr6